MAILHSDVGRAFYGSFRSLRPAQRSTIQPILDGRDLLLLAGTGTGKTEAVLAPLVQRWLATMRESARCTILYVTPTRALANDLLRRLQPIIESLGLIIGIRHGERNDLTRSQQPHVLITTPESFDVLMTTQKGALRSVRSVVFDEVHLLYNTQRGFQVAVLLKRLEAETGSVCQFVALSATVAEPKDIWLFFRPFQAEVVTVVDDQPRPIDAVLCDVATDQDLLSLVERLGSGSRGKFLLFANSRRECDRIGAVLRQSATFASVFVHHSSLDRAVRLEAERAFQEAHKAICVATSTLELGIDIGDIDLVMLYGCPAGWESFLQRIGRGNRRDAKSNVACLVSPVHGSRFKSILTFKALLRQIRTGHISRERPLDVYGAAVQQLLSVISAANGSFRRLADLTAFFQSWGHLCGDIVSQMLDRLVESGHVTRHDFQNRYGGAEGLHRLRDLRLIWGNFPARAREVPLVAANREIGTVPASNLLRMAPGSIVRFGGRHWRVRRMTFNHVEVEASRGPAALDISYGGSGAPLDATVVEAMLQLLEAGVDDSDMAVEAGRDFVAWADRVRPYVGWDRVAVARDVEGRFCYCTFAGRILNSVIGHWSGMGWFEADDVILRTSERVDFASLPEGVDELNAYAAAVLQVPDELTHFQGLLPPELLTRECTDAWCKTAVYERSLTRLRRARVVNAPISDIADLI